MMIGKATQLLFISRSKNRGFTLIELLIAITILGILAAIVIPSYNAQMRTTRRGDGVAAMMQIAQNLERCRSDTQAYNNAVCTAPYVNPVNSDRGFYTITVVAGSATTFTLTAVPTAGTPQAGDTHCAQLTYNQAGVKTAQDNTAADTTADCWK